ncbi:photosystem II repair protein PSB27-H1, chloroplastic-like [Durio zibethinus]|uniref:Photosystem II repair protein PSB27-H1, chloroplastic-like n=1 Tax=Durio zibethinus TaxID=66656 RepID=A0A6P5Z803_DURZI|nr:photosystem II repair protein PSB27-H1, chloroplastic-like [Durio zibethinus]
MASPTLLIPTFKLKPFISIKAKATSAAQTTSLPSQQQPLRRHFLSHASATTTTTLSLAGLPPVTPAFAASDEEYVKEAADVINKVRSTVNMDKNNPNVASAVAELREMSNSWVAKYRREKAFLGRVSFRDIYSALNAVSGHYISFRPTTPILAKRKARILEVMCEEDRHISDAGLDSSRKPDFFS